MLLYLKLSSKQLAGTMFLGGLGLEDWKKEMGPKYLNKNRILEKKNT